MGNLWGIEYEECINILIIGVKNSGKTFLVNRLLWETRALSMENHYTSKLNAYNHSKYPIVFYDISGFKENEDDEIKNLNSKIEEFNKDYKNIKNKINSIFYVIDCNSSRILQNKEKQVIENIFEINIPIFIIGQNAKKTNIKNFIRKTKFELTTLSDKYKEKVEILKNRIFCLDQSKESVLELLKSVYDELLLIKEINEEILKTSSNLNNEELIGRSFSDNYIINNPNEEKKIIKEIYDYVQKSILFNNFIETLKDLYYNILKIKEKFKRKNYYFSNLDIESINNEIQKEFFKIFNEEDLNEINSLILEQKKDLVNKNKDIGELEYYYIGDSFGVGITLVIYLFFSSAFAFIAFQF